MKRAGDFLREERVRQGKSLEEFSQVTKIRVEFLEAIEKGDYKSLPDYVYTRGFIVTYARALGLEEEKVLPFYRREQKRLESDKEVSKVPQALEAVSFKVTPMKIFGALVAMALTIFLLFLFVQYRSFAGQPVLIVDAPPNNYVTSGETVQVIGKTDPQAQLSINGENIRLSVDGSFRIPFELENGLNRIRIVAKSRLGKEKVVERVVEREGDDKPL